MSRPYGHCVTQSERSASGFHSADCGAWHNELPMAFHTHAPAAWAPDMEGSSVVSTAVSGAPGRVRTCRRVRLCCATHDVVEGIEFGGRPISARRRNIDLRRRSGAGRALQCPSRTLRRACRVLDWPSRRSRIFLVPSTGRGDLATRRLPGRPAQKLIGDEPALLVVGLVRLRPVLKRAHISDPADRAVGEPVLAPRPGRTVAEWAVQGEGDQARFHHHQGEGCLTRHQVGIARRAGHEVVPPATHSRHPRGRRGP
jgi:hypothetical protein